MTGPGTPALEALGLTKRYMRGATALDDVTLAVPAGSITALVGPNAAGKSTLIRTWVAFERPTSGSVRVSGIDPWRDRNGAIDQLSFVPQSPDLYRGLSVRDHLTMASRARPSFDLAAAFAHLDELRVPQHAKAGRLSGGQQAQVMLSVALATRAKVLLLDEPVASLDPLARSEFLQLVQRTVRVNGSTALLSSHIVADLVGICDEMIILGVGRVLLQGNVAGILAWHAVIQGDAGAGPTVAQFPDEAGVLVSLVRLNTPVQHERVGLRRATLDEIVRGYLVAARSSAGTRSSG